MAVNKLSLPAKENAVQLKINEIIDNLGGGGTATDVQINGTTITANNVANIVTNSTYNASSNKIATMSDIPSTSNFLTKNTDQTVTSVKTFKNESSGSAINGGLLFDYNTTQGGVVAQQSDGLLVSGYSTNLKLDGSDITVGSNNYSLINPQTGIIPDARISSNIARTSQIPDTSIFEETSNKVTSISSQSTDTQYPSAKSVVELLKTIYPVGSVYLSTNATCPMASLFGTWTLVSSGKALWTGNGTNGNTTIAAGLPNITGGDIDAGIGSISVVYDKTDYWSALTYKFTSHGSEKGTAKGSRTSISFDASNSNSIYGNSTTVQPPAYVVNVWRRTA